VCTSSSARVAALFSRQVAKGFRRKLRSVSKVEVQSACALNTLYFGLGEGWAIPGKCVLNTGYLTTRLCSTETLPDYTAVHNVDGNVFLELYRRSSLGVKPGAINNTYKNEIELIPGCLLGAVDVVTWATGNGFLKMKRPGSEYTAHTLVCSTPSLTSCSHLRTYCGFETRWGERMFSIYLILPAALRPGVYSASNRCGYHEQKNNISGE
jgi:hypothetical protein